MTVRPFLGPRGGVQCVSDELVGPGFGRFILWGGERAGSPGVGLGNEVVSAVSRLQFSQPVSKQLLSCFSPLSWRGGGHILGQQETMGQGWSPRRSSPD